MQQPFLNLLIIIQILLGFCGISYADLTTGLIAHYKFEGDANDSSGNGNDGVIHGALPTIDRFGNADSAYQFDGVNDYIIIQSDQFQNHPFSFQVWFKTESESPGSIINYVNGNQYFGWNVNNNYNESIDFSTVTSNGSPITRATTNALIDDNIWHQLVGTADGTSLHIYFDGVLVATTNFDQIVWTSPMYLYIGSSRPESSINPIYWFEGSLDDIRIYDRAISEPEVQELFQSGLTGVVESGYPTADPNSAKIGEPIVFELKTTRAVDKVEIDMGGGDGFQQMYPEQGNITWRLTRHVGFALSGTKTVNFKVYDPGDVLLSSPSVTVNLSTDIYSPPYTRGNPGRQAVPSSHGVALFNGNLYRQFTDMTAPNRGLSFILSRNFNNLDKKYPGWRFNYSQKIGGTENAAYIEKADGNNEWYYKSAGVWYAHDRSFDMLKEQTDGSFDLYTKSNLHYHFEPLTDGGKLVSVSDRNANSLALFYDTNGFLDYIRDNQTRTYDFTVDADGNIIQVTDFALRSVEYTWTDGKLTAVKDVRGYTTQYQYDLRGNLASIIDPRINSINYGYDINNRVETFTDENGHITTYEYGFQDGTPATKVHFPIANMKTGYWFDDQGRLKETINARNYKSSSLYKNPNEATKIAESLLITRTTTPRGTETHYDYSDDGRGNKTLVQQPDKLSTNLEWQTESPGADAKLTNQNLLKKYSPPGIGTAAYNFTYADTGQVTELEDPLHRLIANVYNSGGQITSKTDARLNSSSYSYDSNGFLHQVTDPDNKTTTYTSRDALGRPTAVTDKRGNTTHYTYDAAGNVLTETDPMGGVAEYAYDENGNLTSTTDPRNTVTSHSYDNGNQLLTTTITVDGTTYTQSNSYDALGRLISNTNRNNRTSHTSYDLTGNVFSRKDPLTNTVKYSYDDNNNIKTVIDKEGRTTFYTYDHMDRVVEVKDDQDHTQKTSYNNQRLVASREDTEGRVTNYAYDIAGQLTTVTDPDDGITEITYDANGNQETVTDPENHITTYTYDKLNRLTELTDHNGHAWQYDYDANGNQIIETKPDGSSIETAYDANDRVSSKSEYDTGHSLVRTLSYGYDANGNTTSVSDGSTALHYTYDELNRVKTATDHYGITLSYQYDGVGNLTRLTYPNNKTVQYSYDLADRLQQVTDWLNNTTTYTRNNSGQVAGIALGNGAVVSKTYDSVGKLVLLENKTPTGEIISRHQMTLDKEGNIVQSQVQLPLQPTLPNGGSMSYDAANRILQSAGSTFTHDPNGRITEQQDTGITITYNFNAQDLITSIEEDGTTTAEYIYDVNNNRVSRIISGVETRFEVDINAGLPRILAETDSSGTVQRYYIYGEGLLAQIDGVGNEKFYHFNPTGHTLALTDSSGAVTDRYAYTPYGHTTSVSTTPNPFQYVGKYGVIDDGNGLHYMRARYYKEGIKRFMSLDALLGDVESPQSLNRYAYVQGNPIMGIDPSGMITDISYVAFKTYVENEPESVWVRWIYWGEVEKILEEKGQQLSDKQKDFKESRDLIDWLMIVPGTSNKPPGTLVPRSIFKAIDYVSEKRLNDNNKKSLIKRGIEKFLSVNKDQNGQRMHDDPGLCSDQSNEDICN